MPTVTYQRGEIVCFVVPSTAHYIGRNAETYECPMLVEVVSLNRDRTAITAYKSHPMGARLKVEHMTRQPTMIYTLGTAPCRNMPEGSGIQPAARSLFSNGGGLEYYHNLEALKSALRRQSAELAS